MSTLQYPHPVSSDLQRLAERLSLTVQPDSYNRPFLQILGRYGEVLYRGSESSVAAFLAGYQASLRHLAN